MTTEPEQDRGQSQAPLDVQLRELVRLGNQFGFYDAADFVTSQRERLGSRPVVPVREGIDTQPERVEILTARIASAMTWIDRYESKNGSLTLILDCIKDSLTGVACVDATPGALSAGKRFAAGERNVDHV